VPRGPRTLPCFTGSTPPAAKSHVTPTSTGSTTATPGAPVKPPASGARFTCLSPEQMAQRRLDDLCYNCLEKFSREHIKQCTMKGIYCHTRFSVENRMHLICVPGSQFHTYDRLMSVISQDIAQDVQKRFINFYYTHDGRHEGLYTNNDNYEDATPSSSSTGI
jgi:hypothetical protein